jgi:hypothetical protein
LHAEGKKRDSSAKNFYGIDRLPADNEVEAFQ